MTSSSSRALQRPMNTWINSLGADLARRGASTIQHTAARVCSHVVTLLRAPFHERCSWHLGDIFNVRVFRKRLGTHTLQGENPRHGPTSSSFIADDCYSYVSLACLYDCSLLQQYFTDETGIVLRNHAPKNHAAGIQRQPGTRRKSGRPNRKTPSEKRMRRAPTRS